MLTLFILACGGAPADTGAAATDTDADTDSDADADSDADSDSDTTTEDDRCTVDGSVVGYDGTTPAGVQIQVCSQTCIPAETESDGSFHLTNIVCTEYKVDALGELIEGGDYGRIRAHLSLTHGTPGSLGAPLYLPQMTGPQSITSSGTYTFGNVSWTVNGADLEVPFGEDEGMFSVGEVSADKIPALWGVTPAVAVTFLPLATVVSGAFDVDVAGDFTGTYDVYSVDEHGSLEGPIGTATGADGHLVASGIQPTLLTWLLFVAH